MKFKDIQATIEIDLTKPEDELWNNIDKKERYAVRKAENKYGLLVLSRKKLLKDSMINITGDIKNNDADLEEFYRIYKRVCINGGIKEKPIEELGKEDIFLFVIDKDKCVIAGAVLEINDNRLILKYAAASQDEPDKYSNSFLYWKLIQFAKNQGFKIFDLGGYQLGRLGKYGKLRDINRFKERWGGRIVTYNVYSKNPIYILGRKAIRNFPVLKKLKNE